MISKQPHIQFYTGDWLKDPHLSMCAPASRGVWIDLICAMHENSRTGELRGTSDQLARLARCSTAELVAALTDLQNNQAAGAEYRNGSWLVANRRMQKEALRRAQRVRAGSLGGSKTQARRGQNPDNDIDKEECLLLSNCNSNNGLEKVRAFAKEKGIKQADADWFYYKGKGNGWTNRGQPILDWKATLLSWQRAGFLPSQKNKESKIKMLN